MKCLGLGMSNEQLEKQQKPEKTAVPLNLLVGKRGAAMYKGRKITGEIVDVCYGKISIYPDMEVGPIDAIAWVFDKDEVEIL